MPASTTGRKPLPGDGGQDPVLLESAAPKGDSGQAAQAYSSAEGPSCPLAGSAQGPGLRASGTHTLTHRLQRAAPTCLSRGAYPQLWLRCRPPRGPHGAAAQDSQGSVPESGSGTPRGLRVRGEGGLLPQRPPGGLGGAGRGVGEAPGKIIRRGAECEPEGHPGECTASPDTENASPLASRPPACLGGGGQGAWGGFQGLEGS